MSDDLKTLETEVDSALEAMEAATKAIREAGDDANFDTLERQFRQAEVTTARPIRSGNGPIAKRHWPRLGRTCRSTPLMAGT